MTSRPFRFRWRTQTFRANLLDSLCDVLHTYGLDFGLHLRHLRDEYTRKEVGDYYAAMCPISHNILLRLEAVVNMWTKRVTRGLIGRVRSANICGGRKLHKYVSTNVWTMKNVSTQQMSRSVRYMTLQSGTVALRWLFSCWNKHGRLSPGRRRRLIRGESPRSKGRTSFEVPPEKNFPLRAMHPLQWKTTSIEVNPLE